MGKCWERGWSREEKRDNWLNCVSEETEGSNRSQNSSCEGGRIPSSFEVEGEQKRCMNSKFVCLGKRGRWTSSLVSVFSVK